MKFLNCCVPMIAPSTENAWTPLVFVIKTTLRMTAPSLSIRSQVSQGKQEKKKQLNHKLLFAIIRTTRDCSHYLYTSLFVTVRSEFSVWSLKAPVRLCACMPVWLTLFSRLFLLLLISFFLAFLPWKRYIDFSQMVCVINESVPAKR